MVRHADSDGGNCPEDSCVQGEAEASLSFITLGFTDKFNRLVCSFPIFDLIVENATL